MGECHVIHNIEKFSQRIRKENSHSYYNNGDNDNDNDRIIWPPENEKSIGEENEKGEKSKEKSSHHLFHLLSMVMH